VKFPWWWWALAVLVLILVDVGLWWTAHETSGDTSKAYSSAGASVLVAIVALGGSAMSTWWTARSAAETNRRAAQARLLGMAEIYFSRAWDLNALRDEWMQAQEGSAEKRELGIRFDERMQLLKEREDELRSLGSKARLTAKSSDEQLAVINLFQALLARGDGKEFEGLSARRAISGAYTAFGASVPTRDAAAPTV
jgi:hypothetical protein